MKAIAARDQDWVDMKGILVRQGPKLDWEQVLTELKPLCELKESPDMPNQLERMRSNIARGHH